MADRATLLATAALALSQVNRVIGAVRGRRRCPIPDRRTALNATLEFDVHAGLDRGAAMAETSLVLLLTVGPLPGSMRGAKRPPRHG